MITSKKMYLMFCRKKIAVLQALLNTYPEETENEGILESIDYNIKDLATLGYVDITDEFHENGWEKDNDTDVKQD